MERKRNGKYFTRLKNSTKIYYKKNLQNVININKFKQSKTRRAFLKTILGHLNLQHNRKVDTGAIIHKN